VGDGRDVHPRHGPHSVAKLRQEYPLFKARDLPLLAVFAAVARAGSFTAAGKELGLGKSVVSDHVRTLEERCGVRLLERSTRRVRLTQVGEQVLALASSISDATRELDGLLQEHREAAVGTLRIATTHDLGARLVAPVAARLLLSHPQLLVDIVCDDKTADLIGDGFDLAVRLGAPRDSVHIVRRLAVIPELIVVAPSIADAYARITRPRELAGAPWARHSLLGGGDSLTFLGPRGEKETVVLSPRASANTGEALRSLLLAGVGFGMLPEHVIADDLRRGALVQLCAGWAWKHISLYAELPSAKRRPRRTQLFLAALKEAFSPQPPPGSGAAGSWGRWSKAGVS
jgi:DNA-binding transcriptional LysR family regulator